jgi:hypothetical protein
MSERLGAKPEDSRNLRSDHPITGAIKFNDTPVILAGTTGVAAIRAADAVEAGRSSSG